jgi:hypothetical protein
MKNIVLRARQVSVAAILYLQSILLHLESQIEHVLYSGLRLNIFLCLSTGIRDKFKQHSSASFKIRIYYSFMKDNVVGTESR